MSIPNFRNVVVGDRITVEMKERNGEVTQMYKELVTAIGENSVSTMYRTFYKARGRWRFGVMAGAGVKLTAIN